LHLGVRSSVTLVIAADSFTTFCDPFGRQRLQDAAEHAATSNAELRLVCRRDEVARAVRLPGTEGQLGNGRGDAATFLRRCGALRCWQRESAT
jgi:hypothetical protein